MNLVFTLIMLISIIMLTIVSPNKVLDLLIVGSKNGLNLCLKLFCIYTVWLSVFCMITSTGLDKKISKLFSPIITKLFKTKDKETIDQIAINMSSNFLGMGGVSTKAGINAINLLDTGKDYASDDMLMLFVINCTSIQLIPTTLISLRLTLGSANCSDIILPSLINTIITTFVGIVLVKIFSCNNNKRYLSNNFDR